MSTHLITAENNHRIQTFESGGETLTPTQVLHQVQQIQTMMKSVFQADVHYGKIPGCGPKPTLLKPGAEKLGFLFRLSPEVNVEEIDLGNDHRQYKATVILAHVLSGKKWGTGVGICSTKESRYRYRWDDTGKPVPSAYWDNRDLSLIGGSSYAAKKKNGRWMICRKIEIEDPADYWNTCLKIAKKRAHVDAILSATACSDIFTQDVEDMPRQAFDTQPIKPAPTPAPTPSPTPKVSAGGIDSNNDLSDAAEFFEEELIPPADPNEADLYHQQEINLSEKETTDSSGRQGKKITDKQRKRLYAISKANEDAGRGPQVVSYKLEEWFGNPSTNEIRMGKEYDSIVEWVQTGKDPLF